MKTYEEMFHSVLSRRDAAIKQKKQKKMLFIKASAVILGAAAVLGIGIFTNVMKPPKRPTPDQSGIITESSETVTTSTVIETETTAEKTTASATASTLAVTTSSTEVRTISIVTSTPKATGTARTTAARTTARTAQTSTVTAAPQTTAAETTGSSADTVTTQSVLQTVQTSEGIKTSYQYVTTTEMTQTSTPMTTATGDISGKSTYNFEYHGNKYIVYENVVKVDIVNTGSAERVLVNDSEKNIYFEDYVYTLNDISPEFAVAFQTGENTYKLCKNLGYLPDSMHGLFSDIGFEKYWQTESTNRKILNAILSLENAARVPSPSTGGAVLTLSVNCEELGVKGSVLELTENGYLTFNPTGYNYAFFIGKENVEKIVQMAANTDT